MADVTLKHERRGPEERNSVAGAGIPAGRAVAIGSLSRLLWYDRSIRWQLLVTFLLINSVAGIVAGGVVVYNAKRATEVEISASIEVAERFVRGAVDRLAGESGRANLLESLPLHITNLRHVRILITDADGRPVSLQPPATDNEDLEGEQVDVPRWFAQLVQVDDLSRNVPVISGGRRIGTVTVAGEASDEITEVWEDMSDLALLAAVVDLTVIGVLYIALGRALAPLSNLTAGLRELEQGRFRYRLPRPKVRALADIADRFNALASALDAAKTDNARLTRRIVTAQDDERRQIAMELHDELGPNVFGLKANVASLGRLVKTLPADVAGPVRERVETLVEISDGIQTVNRRLLKRIRPMALGHVSLGWAISDLVADFERHGGEHTFMLDIGRLAHSYSDSVDLTIYRCVQEGLTNAARHAEAKTVAIRLDEQTDVDSQDEGGPARHALRLSVEDDGRGITPGTTPGLGLTGMEERVRALGGSFTISNCAGGGTCLDVVIPLQEVVRSAAAGGHTKG